MEVNGESMGLISDFLEEEKKGGSRGDDDRVLFMGDENSFLGETFSMEPFLFSNADGIDGCDVELFEDVEGDVELALASIDDEQVAKIILFFLAGKMTMDHFPEN